MANNIVAEIFQKEKEKYTDLVMLSINDWQEATCHTVKAVSFERGDSFSKIREKLLAYFYETTVNYSAFINEEKACNDKLRCYLFQQSKKQIALLRREKTAVLDEELQVREGLTIAYHPAKSILHDVYERFCRSDQTFFSPKEVHDFFYHQVLEIFPITLPFYIDSLKNNDPSFWEVTCSYIQQIALLVTRYEYKINTNNRDIVADTIWDSTYKALQKKLIDNKSGKKPTFKTGKEFRNYIIGIYQHKEKDFYNKEKQDNARIVYFEEHGYDFAEQENVKGGFNDPDEILNIDPDDFYEIWTAIAIVLCDERHPFRKELTAGIEDKVELLLDKAYREKNYNQIVAEHNGEDLDEKTLQRIAAATRKKYERNRKALQPLLAHRMKQIITRNNQSHG